MNSYRADLHIHTVLSPCGDLGMGAPEIVERAKEEKLSAIAVTDHNAVLNYSAVADAASKLAPEILVIPGTEVQTAEDIHVLGLFPDYRAALSFHEWLQCGLGGIKNDPEIFGHQLVIDSSNSILDEFERLLIQGVIYSIDEVIEKIREHGGISILAHVDRPSFSYISVLGPIPDDLDVDALEISANVDRASEEKFCRKYPERIFTRSSDAHFLKDIKNYNSTELYLAEMSFQELAMAFDPSEEFRKVTSPCESRNLQE